MYFSFAIFFLPLLLSDRRKSRFLNALFQINFILKKYGIAKLPDKDESDRSNKGGTKPVKKSSKPSKEKMALGATASSAKVLPKERKTKLTTGSEKSAKESVSSDPTVKSMAKVKLYPNTN